MRMVITTYEPKRRQRKHHQLKQSADCPQYGEFLPGSGDYSALENLTVIVEPRKLPHNPVQLSHRIHYFSIFGFVLRRMTKYRNAAYRNDLINPSIRAATVSRFSSDDIDSLDRELLECSYVFASLLLLLVLFDRTFRRIA